MNRIFLMVCVGLTALAWSGCDKTVESSTDMTPSDTVSSDVEGTDEPPEVEARPPVLMRLTEAQYRNTIRDLFGESVVVPGGLEPDTATDGLFAVGSSVSSVSPLGAERYSDAARTIAAQVTENPAVLSQVTGCSVDSTDVAGCVEDLVETVGHRIYRRPVSVGELQALVNLGEKVAQVLGSTKDALEYVLSAMLLSPYFLYRVEKGEEAEDGTRHYTSWEMASRLSYFLWNTMPDEELIAAAEADQLVADETLQVQVERMLKDPRARQGVRNFFADWLGLFGLDDLKKDPNIFKHYAPELGSMAREETLRVAEDIVFERDADMREFLTTRRTFVNGRLAAIYNVPAATPDGFGAIELPENGPRMGFLGQVSFLAAHAHPVSTSPTQRGVFVREKLLCHSVPSPPADVDTAIPEMSDEAQSLKQRLMVHMQDPSCAPCHAFIDPIGFGLENFDGVGRYRVLDNGIPIDPAGNLDAVDFEGPDTLAHALANHPDYATCIVSKTYAYATGRHVTAVDGPLIKFLTGRFNGEERRLLSLFRDVAMSTGFRRVGEVTP